MVVDYVSGDGHYIADCDRYCWFDFSCSVVEEKKNIIWVNKPLHFCKGLFFIALHDRVYLHNCNNILKTCGRIGWNVVKYDYNMNTRG